MIIIVLILNLFSKILTGILYRESKALNAELGKQNENIGWL